MEFYLLKLFHLQEGIILGKLSSKTRDFITIGFALFAMFFGAGNLIFPPFLGWQSGSSWLIGIIFYMAIDIGMSLMAIIASARIGHGASGITEKLGRIPSFIIISVTCLCIGPMIAIPRTASITYEVGFIPNFGDVSSWIVTGVFFLISWALSIRESKVVDIVGKVLSPVMFIIILIMIIKGFISPLGGIAPDNDVYTAIKDGSLAGYQTMDMLAACLFSITVTSTIIQRGYTDTKTQFSLIRGCGFIAALLLFIVYGGLAYIGATASVRVDAVLTQSELLVFLAGLLMGNVGRVVLGLIVSFACLTTAIGLLTSIASFFEENLHLNYKVLVTAFTIISWIISNFGTSVIIAKAAPVLDLVYPMMIMLIILSIFSRFFTGCHVYRFAAYGALAAGVFTQLDNLLSDGSLSSLLPLSGAGFGWVVPAVVLGVVGYLIDKTDKQQ